MNVLVLYDDARARDWQPFALTRPVGELLFGAHTMRERAERVLGARCAGHLAAPHLLGFTEPDAPPVIERASIATDVHRILLSSRAIPDWHKVPSWPGRNTRLVMAGQVVGWFVPAGEPTPPAAALEGTAASDGDAFELKGRVIDNVWDLIAGNPAQVASDIAAARTRADSWDRLPDHVQLIGAADDVLIGRDVTIEPGVVFDVQHGPIWLDDGAVVRAFTRLAGPSFVGRGSTILGGPLAEVSIGTLCKVHGEVEASIVLGYANKAHDGFLGHAYLGRWVNLGALTTNSDLKNNYGTIRLWTPRGDVDTGEIKIGCLLGDHVKTGIGTMLNTGTIVGAGSNLFGAAMPPKYVPPFSWGSGDDLGGYDLDKFLHTATTVMQRRGLELSEPQRALFGRAHALGRQGF